MFAVKENQRELYQDIESAFLIPSNDKSKVHISEEVGSGRVEKRTCTVIDDLSHLKNPTRWESLQSIVKIESERYIKSTKKTQIATRYYISSLPCDANKIALAVRSHWKIENNLHWHLDVSFGEDKSGKKT